MSKKTLLILASAVAVGIWLLVVAFGNQLGVPVEVQESVKGAFAAIAGVVGTLLSQALRSDSDGDGVPDMVDDD